MSRRTNQPDTPADVAIRDCLTSRPPQSFIMVAGAGSGKTTSLIKALSTILKVHGDTLRMRRQRIACITYTEIAAGEIWQDVGNDPLVHVSTIHSYLWSLVRGFQPDIQAWTAARIDEKLEELHTAAANFGPRVHQKTRDKNRRDIERYGEQKRLAHQVRAFTYGTGSDYGKGVLGHDDIIKMVSQLLLERPLLRTLLARQYPFVFVDESQDTMAGVVDALTAVDRQEGERFCLGFFGDPMQQIYPTGVGTIPVQPGWRMITKPENFRCPTAVLAVANAIRRDGDGLVQTRGRMIKQGDAEVSMPGTARLFVLPADQARSQRLSEVRRWVANANDDQRWTSQTGTDVKVLVIVHRMAATRLGFGTLYAALNDKAPENFKSGFLDGSAWPVRPFFSFVLPLVQAARCGQEFEVMQVLRAHTPLLMKDKLSGVDVSARLSDLRAHTSRLVEMMSDTSQTTAGEILLYLLKSGLLELDPRFSAYLNQPPFAVGDGDDDDGEETSREIAAMEALLACPANQFWGYRTYVAEESPFSTQQGIKGAEFERVLTVLDDDEGTHVQFSYEKYLGLKPLSDADRKNIAQNKETSVDRTRRLFYVCCSRALQDLVVVLFTHDPDAAVHHLRGVPLFPQASILTASDLTAV